MNGDTNEGILEVLAELLVWTKFANLDRLISTLRTVLADPRHAKAYELTDGNRSQVEVAKGSGLSQPAVSGLWAKWRRLGIVQDRGARPKHLVQPSDYGLVGSPDGSQT